MSAVSTFVGLRRFSYVLVGLKLFLLVKSVSYRITVPRYPPKLTVAFPTAVVPVTF